MAGHLTPTTFRGNNINDGSIYEAKFVEPRGGLEAHRNHHRTGLGAGSRA